MDYPLTQPPGLCRYVRTCVLGFPHGGAASALVESLLPGVLRERARVGTGQDHRGLDAVRLSLRACSPDRRTGRARGCVLRNATLPVGLVQATARAGLRALGHVRRVAADLSWANLVACLLARVIISGIARRSGGQSPFRTSETGIGVPGREAATSPQASDPVWGR